MNLATRLELLLFFTELKSAGRVSLKFTDTCLTFVFRAQIADGVDPFYGEEE